MQSISAKALYEKQAQGECFTLIDVRTPAEFCSVHAPGAHLFPLDRFDPDAVMAALPEAGLGKDKPVYVTCHSGLRAKQAAEKLTGKGYPNVVLLDGGMKDWVAADLPVVQGRKVIALDRQVQIAVGSLVILGVVLGFAVHAALFGLAAVAGAGLINAGITQNCAMAHLIARLPWNQQQDPQCGASLA